MTGGERAGLGRVLRARQRICLDNIREAKKRYTPTGFTIKCPQWAVGQKAAWFSVRRFWLKRRDRLRPWGFPYEVLLRGRGELGDERLLVDLSLDFGAVLRYTAVASLTKLIEKWDQLLSMRLCGSS